MVLMGTLIVLGLWLAFIWYVDPDDLRRVAVQYADRKPILKRRDQRLADLRETWLHGEKESGP